jgi:hypothetical protein
VEQITIPLSSEQVGKLDFIAERLGVPREEVVGAVIQSALNALDSDPLAALDLQANQRAREII